MLGEAAKAGGTCEVRLSRRRSCMSVGAGILWGKSGKGSKAFVPPASPWNNASFPYSMCVPTCFASVSRRHQACAKRASCAKNGMMRHPSGVRAGGVPLIQFFAPHPREKP